MAAIDPALLEAAGFAGASAGQAITSAQSKAAIGTNQLNLGGVQERRGITDSAETSGMLRSSRTATSLGEQTAGQGNRQQLIDLGLSDTIAGANIDVMQELARKQAEAEAAAQQRAMFDAQMALQWQQYQAQAPGVTAEDATAKAQAIIDAQTGVPAAPAPSGGRVVAPNRDPDKVRGY